MSEICRKEGISVQAFYRRKPQYGSMGGHGGRRLTALEEKNRRLKHLIGE